MLMLIVCYTQYEMLMLLDYINHFNFWILPLLQCFHGQVMTFVTSYPSIVLTR